MRPCHVCNDKNTELFRNSVRKIYLALYSLQSSFDNVITYWKHCTYLASELSLKRKQKQLESMVVRRRLIFNLRVLPITMHCVMYDSSLTGQLIAEYKQLCKRSALKIFALHQRSFKAVVSAMCNQRSILIYLVRKLNAVYNSIDALSILTRSNLIIALHAAVADSSERQEWPHRLKSIIHTRGNKNLRWIAQSSLHADARNPNNEAYQLIYLFEIRHRSTFFGRPANRLHRTIWLKLSQARFFKMWNVKSRRILLSWKHQTQVRSFHATTCVIVLRLLMREAAAGARQKTDSSLLPSTFLQIR